MCFYYRFKLLWREHFSRPTFILQCITFHQSYRKPKDLIYEQIFRSIQLIYKLQFLCYTYLSLSLSNTIIYHINKCKQIGLILFPTIFHPENMFVSYFIICDIANCDTFYIQSSVRTNATSHSFIPFPKPNNSTKTHTILFFILCMYFVSSFIQLIVSIHNTLV